MMTKMAIPTAMDGAMMRMMNEYIVYTCKVNALFTLQVV